MGVWGLYYDLLNFGSFDFVSQAVEKGEYVLSSGVMSVFKSLGCFLAPILAGFIANIAGFAYAFSILGVMGVLGAILVNQLTPKYIRVRVG